MVREGGDVRQGRRKDGEKPAGTFGKEDACHEVSLCLGWVLDS
jgi:hypothetical protein